MTSSHDHWPSTWQALGSPKDPTWLCACGAMIRLDRSTGRFEGILGIAAEHSIQDPFTGEITVTVNL